MATRTIRVQDYDIARLQELIPNSFDKFNDYFHYVITELERYQGSGEAQTAKDNKVPQQIADMGTIKDMLHDILAVASENNDRLFGRNGVAMYGDAKKVKPPVEFIFEDDGYMVKPHYIEREEMQYLRLHPKDLEKTCNYLKNFLNMEDEDIEIFRDMCRKISLEEDEDW